MRYYNRFVVIFIMMMVLISLFFTLLTFKSYDWEARIFGGVAIGTFCGMAVAVWCSIFEKLWPTKNQFGRVLFETEVLLDTSPDRGFVLCRDALNDLKGTHYGDKFTWIEDNATEGTLAVEARPVTREHSIVAAAISSQQDGGSFVAVRSGLLSWIHSNDLGENERNLEKILEYLQQHANVTVVKPIHSPISVFPPWKGPLTIKVP
jgi:hypothetical protein